MELHTLGVDGGYTQKDIVEVAKAFTGWTIADPRGYRRAAASDDQGRRGSSDRTRLQRHGRRAGRSSRAASFISTTRWHDKDAKTVLGQKVDEGGVKDGLKVIDILVKHPSTAKFIARKLAVKFVSDNPSEALVDRVADAFHEIERRHQDDAACAVHATRNSSHRKITGQRSRRRSSLRSARSARSAATRTAVRRCSRC